jgi:hypothetical protein
MICQHVQCRARQGRQDLQCVRPLDHEGNHYHSIGLGWCRKPIEGQGGRHGGHVNPVQEKP